MAVYHKTRRASFEKYCHFVFPLHQQSRVGVTSVKWHTYLMMLYTSFETDLNQTSLGGNVPYGRYPSKNIVCF